MSVFTIMIVSSNRDQKLMNDFFLNLFLHFILFDLVLMLFVYFWAKYHSLNLEFTNFTMLAGQKSIEILLSLPSPQLWASLVSSSVGARQQT